jgi:hypothetical protein
LAFVYQGSEEQAAGLFVNYGLEDVARVHDPAAVIYRAFGLQRASLGQIVGLTVMRRGLQALMEGSRVGKPSGDGFQMPGVFLLYQGRIVQSFYHKTIADRPDYDALAVCELTPERES